MAQSRKRPRRKATKSLASITWRLDAHAGHWLPIDELTAVIEWLAANKASRATAQHPIVVARGRITYGRDLSDSTVRGVNRQIVTTTLPLRTAPPTVWQPDCTPADMAALHRVFEAHEWSSGCDGVCVDCSITSTNDKGQTLCHHAESWPCTPVWEALTTAGIPVPDNPDGGSQLLLGDLLDPDVNADAFGDSSPGGGVAAQLATASAGA